MTMDVSAVAVARCVAAATESVDGVARLDGGIVGGFSTYGEGTRVKGVKVIGSPAKSISLQVVAELGRPLADIGDDVRRVVAEEVARQLPELPTPSVEVHIADLVDPSDIAIAAAAPTRRRVL